MLEMRLKNMLFKSIRDKKRNKNKTHELGAIEYCAYEARLQRHIFIVKGLHSFAYTTNVGLSGVAFSKAPVFTSALLYSSNR
ncbi:hypothetical protein RIVM261_077660 [Rivularia sp. IAM M-261]|nr:hypothetical protein CAL7716_065760 [Calothrix sp. PCC 7716]GJD22810.1 hypothetical protein RIVM261_077660 [Rivularia sp. IAM M-261]